MFSRLKFTFGLVCLGVTGCLAGHAQPMRVGFETNAEPMSFTDANGRIAGFSVDMIHAIAAEMKFEVAAQTGVWIDIFDRFKAGQIDVLASLAYSQDREEFIDFAVTHVVMNGTLFVHRGDRSIHTLDDLRGRRLAVQLHGFSHEYIAQHHWDQNLVIVDTFRDAMHALNDGRCDAVAAIDIIGAGVIREDGLRDVEATELKLPGFTYELHMGLHLGDRKRLAVLNEGLARIRANGTYDKIYEKWIGPLKPRRLRFSDFRPYFPPLVILLAVALGTLIWQRQLLRRLAHRTEQLRQSEERLTLVLAGSEDGFWDWDLTTGHIARSERWAGMLGYTLDEISPTIEGGSGLLHPDDREIYYAWQTRLDAGETDRYDIEYRMKAKSGEWRWIHDRGKVVARTPDGRAIRMAGTHTDITERKRIEAALAENRALLARSAHLLEQTQAVAHIGGWEVNLRTDSIFWSAETYRLHDATPETYHPTVASGLAFYAPECRPVITSAIEAAARVGTPFDLELELITARGRRIHVRVTAQTDQEEGQVVRIFGSIQDITAEKRAEEERKKLQVKMLEAQKLESLGVLAGGIAHDFNNLLTVILANATFARASIGSAGDERLAHIETAARRAADLCRQMLAYAGRGSFIVERLDLGDMVQDTSRLLQVSLSKKAVLQVSLTPQLPPVEADASQIRQVVMNLVINASEALGDTTGLIRLSTCLGRPEPDPGRVVHAFDLPPGDCICLEVADTGSGMSAATLARVFDPFFTTKFAGRGLGLAAVLGIVRAHHGALSVESQPGHGTTFRLYLPPASSKAKPAAAPAGASAPPAAGASILLVDDEPVVLATAEAVLRHHGYRTTLAADGQEAVRIFRANPGGFTAVLLDLTMPGLDGAEALRTIRTLNPHARVLIMSGYSEHDIVARMRGQGRVPVLHKPFSQETLLARVAELIAAPP